MSAIKWIKASSESCDIYGIDENYQRIPEEIAKEISKSVQSLAKNTAGGRIRLTTDSSRLYVRGEAYGSNETVGFDVYKMEHGAEIFVTGLTDVSGKRMVNGKYESREKESSLSSNGEKCCYTLNFPHSACFKNVEIGIDEEAVLEKGAPYINEKPVVFYGSSITHGYSASRPGTTYEAQISQKYNLNYINLGVNGAAKGEGAMARYIADLDMSAFVMDYDHNAYEEGQLEATHLPFYKLVREKHPDIPVIFVTRPDYNRNIPDNEKRARTVYKTYEYAKSRGERVYFIHGKALFSGDYYHNCTIDGCHPNDLGMYRMASVIGKVLAKALELEPEREKHDFEMYELQ